MFKGRKARSVRLLKAFSVCLIILAGESAHANVKSALEGHDVINIWPGVAPGTEDWTGSEFTGKRSVTNVTVPTLTVFSPEPGKANGNAVVICPGGGFTGLSIIEEGTMVAEWLAARGITAFILKYRVRHRTFSPPPAIAKKSDSFDERARALEPGRKIAAADALQAMRHLRAKASDYEIDPNRIGMMGFSAGAMTTMSVVMEGEPNDIPNFAAPIYGAMPGKTPPEKAPPLFIVHAQDDGVVPASKSIEMYTVWSAKGLPVELHVFEKGGHGFGAIKRGRPTDQWMDVFERWLLGQGWIDPVRK